jgi:predicted GH43/DUF377 family glycosyl hydrolase
MIFNAAAVNQNNEIHVVYRAIGEDNISRLGYASSSDGYHIDERLENPIFEPANESEIDGCEDPRLTLLEGKYVMTYTALKSLLRCAFQIGITTISKEDFAKKQWNWGERLRPFPGIRNKNAVLFPQKIDGKYVMYHRIEPDICISYSDDLQRWYDIKAVLEPREGMWDRLKVGAAGPPIKLDDGWLFIYHGVNFDHVYRLGVAFIDKKDPENILYRSKEPILEPIKDYEKFGKVPNVVFSCGAVPLDDNILIYYGGADTVVCVATYELNELLP